MKLARRLLGTLAVGAALAQGACDTGGGGEVRAGRRLAIEIVDYDDVAGSPLDRRTLVVDEPQPFTVVVRALDERGNLDPTFNGYVRLSAKPGSVDPLADGEGRNVELVDGESDEVEVRLTNAYGTTFILADDLGYVPVDPLRDPPPACSNGIDDDGDGKIDFPADEGCAFANDDSETGGSYAQGASPPIYFQLPRIADVRGLKCDAAGACIARGKTPYPKEQVFLDTGYHDKPDGTREFDFDMVVTRIASDGFYLTDTSDPRGGFNSIFVYNFSAPPRMRVCDRMKTFAGTASEFFGLTQISFPSWTLEEWDPRERPCLVPEPTVLGPEDVPHPGPNGNMRVPAELLRKTGGLVRAYVGEEGETLMVTPKFGPGKMREQNGVFVPSEDATDCDLDDDGRIDFSNGSPEQRCSDACTRDPECTEYSNFAARSTFRLTISDGNVIGAIQADATAAIDFHPLEMKGKPLKAFTGTLHYFSGGSQYTIEARCKDDIVVDLSAEPLPSDKACVFPRTIREDAPQ